MAEAEATLEDLERLKLRVGVVRYARPFPEARKPAIKLWIDFGAFGVRQSSAQLTRRYQPEDLEGRQVVAATGLPPLTIAGFKSEVLVLGAVAEEEDVSGTSDVSLLNVDHEVEPGTPIA